MLTHTDNLLGWFTNVLSDAELARIVDVTPATIDRWRLAGQLPDREPQHTRLLLLRHVYKAIASQAPMMHPDTWLSTWSYRHHVTPIDIIRSRLLLGAEGDITFVARISPEAFCIWGALEWEARQKLSLDPQARQRIEDALHFGNQLRYYLLSHDAALEPNAEAAIGVRKPSTLCLDPYALQNILPNPDPDLPDQTHRRRVAQLLADVGWLTRDTAGKAARPTRTASGVRRMWHLPSSLVDDPAAANASLIPLSVKGIIDHPGSEPTNSYPYYRAYLS